MSISEEVREQVRQRANYACEYCGVTETDAAGQLTIDHFHPQARGGTDAPDNLIYCCHRCNEYKADYWPQEPDAPLLWNPRLQAANTHFVELAGGELYAITATGTFTVNRLRLNRPPLIAHRLRRRQNADEQRLLARLHSVVNLLEQLHAQEAALLEEHRILLQEQRHVLRLLLNRQEPGGT